MGMLKNGLLGLGGVGGLMGPDMPMPFEGYDPAAMKKFALKQAIMQAGLGMLGSQSPSAWGQIADGMRGGLLGAQGSQDAYLRRGLLAEDYKDKKTERARQMKADAWTSTERQHQLDAWNAEDDRRKKMQGYVQSQLGPNTGLPVGQTAQARAYAGMGDYEHAAQALVPGNTGNVEAGLNLVYWKDQNGQLHAGQPLKTGGMQEVPLPQGGQWAPGMQYLDTGTGFTPVDKRGAAVPNAQVIPKDVAGEAQAKETGKGLGQREIDQPQAKLAADTAISALDDLSRAASDLAADPGLDRITGMMGMLPNMPGGDAARANAKLQQLKTRAAFTVLQAMREASKTGGALGAISDRENEMLSNYLAALDNAQSAEDMRVALTQILQYVQGAKQRIGTAYSSAYGGGGAQDGAGQSAQDPLGLR